MASVKASGRPVGNAAVSRVLLQRQEAPPINPPPAVSPEDRQKQLYAATTMREVPPTSPEVKAALGKAISFAPVYDDIQRLHQLQHDLAENAKALDDANNRLSIAKHDNELGSHSGAPGGTDPGSGVPEKLAGDLVKAEADVKELSAKAESLAQQVKDQDAVVKRELAAVGVKDEQELVHFVEEEFPNRFIERGQQVAIAQLDANKAAAEKERDRYKANQGGVGDRGALRDAARDLDRRAEEIHQIWASRKTELPPGGADQNDPGVIELKGVTEKVAPLQEELDKKKTEYQIKFPILFRVDPREMASASDAQLDALINGPVEQILKDIETTRGNISGGSLKIWHLKASGIDLPALTKADMGISPGSTLDQVIEHKAADDKPIEEQVAEALTALSMVADVIGAVTGPVGLAVAGGIAAVAAVANVINEGQKDAALAAAGNTAIDPEVAKMAQENPDLEGLIFALFGAIAATALGVGAIRSAISEYRTAKAAAKDLEEFKKLIEATSLEDAAKRELIGEAERQFAKAPTLDAKVLRQQFEALGPKFSTGDRVATARLLSKVGEDKIAKVFLELREGKINWLTPESLKANGYEAEIANYFGGAKSGSAGFTVGATGGPIFIRPGSYAAVTETVSHEVTHALQNQFEKWALSPKNVAAQFNREHQAFLAQQKFLRDMKEQLGEATFTETFGKDKWLLDANDERIQQEIRKLYPQQPTPADLPPEELERYYNDFLDSVENVRERILGSLRNKLDKK
jgi:hypothetical protein